MKALFFDTSERSCLAVCQCGWRYISTDKLITARVAATHERQCNPASHIARNVLYVTRTRRRHGEMKGGCRKLDT